MDKMCRMQRDVILNINYNADLIFDGINSYQLFYILSNLLRKTECTFIYIGNIINMPIGKELVYNPKISFANHTYVENYKALDDSKYKVETTRTTGKTTNLKKIRLVVLH